MKQTKSELENFFELDRYVYGRPCMIVTTNGRGHIVAITSIGKSFLFGKSAHAWTVCLCQSDSRSPALSAMVASAQIVQQFKTDQKSVPFEQECFVRTEHGFIVNINEISTIDLIECPYFENPLAEGQAPDSEVLLAKIPELERYYSKESGTFALKTVPQMIESHLSPSILPFNRPK
jgi:hypothetical protein